MWNYIIVEGYCLGSWGYGDTEQGKCPCGKESVSEFCLCNDLEQKCPFLGYTKSSVREAAWTVPLHLLIKDKLFELGSTVVRYITWNCLHRWFYDKGWFERNVMPASEAMERKTHDEFNTILAQFREWVSHKSGIRKAKSPMKNPSM
ncbi:MAG: hypothetical protein Q7T57_04615 [Dehalococcoidales bacterium]|nr:hypothetical protein [Dehalococcoidales bacterium]